MGEGIMGTYMDSLGLGWWLSWLVQLSLSYSTGVGPLVDYVTKFDCEKLDYINIQWYVPYNPHRHFLKSH